eukprot:TRINITY_DN2997_c0_g2_i1.p1 TRINITY_DN2997_c0_g2~~TRINITY_DN2997_c0_g2_i1.p1  ORF type:complete len:558 (+),score=178.54 TRINITY_DN2997_c0_g2_i1:34-1674(+)
MDSTAHVSFTQLHHAKRDYSLLDAIAKWKAHPHFRGILKITEELGELEDVTAGLGTVAAGLLWEEQVMPQITTVADTDSGALGRAVKEMFGEVESLLRHPSNKAEAVAELLKQHHMRDGTMRAMVVTGSKPQCEYMRRLLVRDQYLKEQCVVADEPEEWEGVQVVVCTGDYHYFENMGCTLAIAHGMSMATLDWVGRVRAQGARWLECTVLPGDMGTRLEVAVDEEWRRSADTQRTEGTAPPHGVSAYCPSYDSDRCKTLSKAESSRMKAEEVKARIVEKGLRVAKDDVLYKDTFPMAKGTYGGIYRIRFLQKGMEVDAAMKLILESNTSFVREAEKLLRLMEEPSAKRYILEVYGFVTDYSKGGGVVMKLYRCNLDTYAREELPTKNNTVGVTLGHMVELVDAVCTINRCGLVHRDIKPENILVDGDKDDPCPHLCLCDFGVAKDEATIGLSAELGTPEFQAPEIKDGRGATASSETEVYSLGCVFRFMVNHTDNSDARKRFAPLISNLTDNEPSRRHALSVLPRLLKEMKDEYCTEFQLPNLPW